MRLFFGIMFYTCASLFVIDVFCPSYTNAENMALMAILARYAQTTAGPSSEVSE